MSNYGGGGRRGGGGRGRGGRGRGGFGGQGRGHRDPGAEPRLKPCSSFAETGSCPRGDHCSFSHVIKSHAVIDASSVDPVAQQRVQRAQEYGGRGHGHRGYQGQNQSIKYPVSAVSIWNSPGSVIKIFSGSHDGHWRLWNATQNFVKEFDHSMGGGKVETLEVASDYLFCGFEGTSLSVPAARVGMIHAWNLNMPTDPPLEFHVGHLMPYAHNSCVSAFTSSGERIASGSHDGTIRTWQFDASLNSGKGGFGLDKTMPGHAGEVTGLVIVGGAMLWSSGVDGTIRLWDLATAECKYLISQDTPATPGAGGQPPPPQPPPTGGQQPQATGVGHTGAVTDLILFESPHGNFVLSSSLDSTVKAWDASNGKCMFSENHGGGVVSMALSADLKGNPLLLIGMETGAIMMRSILQTANAPPFCLILKLSNKFMKCGHDSSVRCIRTGPGNTFYSAGADGKVCVWQITGDLGL